MQKALFPPWEQGLHTGGGTRTHMGVTPFDFESNASTIPPPRPEPFNIADLEGILQPSGWTKHLTQDHGAVELLSANEDAPASRGPGGGRLGSSEPPVEGLMALVIRGEVALERDYPGERALHELLPLWSPLHSRGR